MACGHISLVRLSAHTRLQTALAVCYTLVPPAGAPRQSATEQAAQTAAEVRRQLSAAIDVAHHLFKACRQSWILRLLGKCGAAGGTGGLLAGQLIAQCLLLSLALHRVAGLAALLLVLALLLTAAHRRAAEAGHAATHAAAVGHALHHLCGLLKALQQSVDLRDGHAGTIGDTGAARTVDNRRITALCRGHRANNRLGAVDLLLIELLKLLAVLGHARNHAEQRLHRTKLAHLLQLIEVYTGGFDMTRKLRAVIPAILCVALAASACSKKEETPTFTGDKTEEPSYQANLDFVTPAAYSNIQGLNLEPGTYISIIGKDENSSYWKEVKKGVEQAVKDLNKTLGYSGEDKIKATFNAPDGEDIDEQVNILDEELARYPDALGIASIDEDACKVQFDAAAENGIPVIALDSGNTYQGIQCTVKTNNTEAAKTVAYQLCNGIEDAGEVLLLASDSNSEAAKERLAGFQEEIKSEHPNVQIVDTIYCDQMDDLKKEIAEQKNAAKKAEEPEITADDLSDEDVILYYMEQHPNLKGMFGTNVTAVQLGLSALKEAEKTDEIVLTGFDAGEAQIEALKNGEIEGLAVQNPFGIGYASVVAAARSILQTGNEALVDTGYVWVTNENMEDASIKNMLYK